MRLSVLALLAALLAVPLASRPARADYWTDQQNDKLREIEYAFDHYTRPTWWDGKQIAPGTTARTVEGGPVSCGHPLERFTAIFPRVDAKIRQTERAQKLQRAYDELVPFCRDLTAAATAFLKGAAEAEAGKAKAEQAERAWDQKRRAFIAEIPQVGLNFIHDFAQIYDPSLNGGAGTGVSDSPAARRAAKEGYEAVRVVCKKHGPLSDPVKPFNKGFINEYPVAICAMAEMGDKLIQKARLGMIMNGVGLYIDDMLVTAQKIADGAQKDFDELTQQRLFETAKWVAVANKNWGPRLAEIGEAMPANAWERIFAKSAELKAKIDKDGTTNSFEAPPFKDGAAEAVAKAAWAKEIKGVKIRKIGTSYNAWNVFDEKTWVKRDSNYDYYRVNKGKNKYKRGWALLEIPGRPYCQAREWIVKRVSNGPIQLDALGGDGTFMKCP